MSTTSTPATPSKRDVELARRSRQALATRINKASKPMRIVPDDASETTITLPAIAVRLLVDMLEQLAQGNAVTIVSHHLEMTTQEAADVLGVSRPYLVKLLNQEEISYKKVGTHRRVRLKDVLRYQQRTDAARRHTLDELTVQAQNMWLPAY